MNDVKSSPAIFRPVNIRIESLNIDNCQDYQTWSNLKT